MILFLVLLHIIFLLNIYPAFKQCETNLINPFLSLETCHCFLWMLPLNAAYGLEHNADNDLDREDKIMGVTSLAVLQVISCFSNF